MSDEKETPDSKLNLLSLRRQAVMLGHHEQRLSDRNLVIAPAAIDVEGTSHVALVRDVSNSGIFVYSDFEPTCGAVIELTMQQKTESSERQNVALKGRVVRVEAGNSLSAVGIAVEVEKTA